jgi:hypothetical protein
MSDLIPVKEASSGLVESVSGFKDVQQRKVQIRIDG